jgi:carboxymethylenebutenolidase
LKAQFDEPGGCPKWKIQKNANMTSEIIPINIGDEGEMFCHFFRSPDQNAPLVVLIQDIFGVNDWLLNLGEKFATFGGVSVIVPDLFWRTGRGISLNPLVEAEATRAFELLGSFDQQKGIADVKRVIQYLKEQKIASNKVGCLGFTIGGAIAFSMAVENMVDCAVCYYPIGVSERLDEFAKIKKPTILHLAGSDKFIPANVFCRMRDQSCRNPLINVFIYPGVGHGFMREGGPAFNVEAYELAKDRTITFLKKHLTEAQVSLPSK